MCEACGGLSRGGEVLTLDLASRIERLSKYGYVGVSISHSDDPREGRDWVVGIEMGREAPDSDMVGGAAYGVAGKLTDALEQALSEAGV
jgi:hypothetical protein